MRSVERVPCGAHGRRRGGRRGVWRACAERARTLMTRSFTSDSMRSVVCWDTSAVRPASWPRKLGPPPPERESCPSFLLKPICVTMARAVRVTCMKSFEAPVVTFSSPKMSSSAMRPPSATAMTFSRYERLYSPDSRRSSLGAKKVSPPAPPRGTMLIFVTGSYSGRSAPTSAWPASWYATSRRLGSEMTAPFFSAPAMIRSSASAISSLVISVRLRGRQSGARRARGGRASEALLQQLRCAAVGKEQRHVSGASGVCSPAPRCPGGRSRACGGRR